MSNRQIGRRVSINALVGNAFDLRIVLSKVNTTMQSWRNGDRNAIFGYDQVNIDYSCLIYLLKVRLTKNGSTLRHNSTQIMYNYHSCKPKRKYLTTTISHILLMKGLQSYIRNQKNNFLIQSQTNLNSNMPKYRERCLKTKGNPREFFKAVIHSFVNTVFARW